MSSLHRILKYTPTVVLTLLVLAWVVSIFRDIGFYSTIPATRGLATLKIGNADIFFRLDRRIFSNVEFATRGPARFTDDPIQLKHVLGCFLFVDNARGPRVDVIIDNLGRYAVRIPLLLLITAILPLAIGSFTSFRFRLWHCLAFTALIAAELAYYFRWQEWIAWLPNLDLINSGQLYKVIDFVASKTPTRLQAATCLVILFFEILVVQKTADERPSDGGELFLAAVSRGQADSAGWLDRLYLDRKLF